MRKRLTDDTGGSAGYVVSFIIFMALNNASFANAYIRRPWGYASSEHGMVTLGGFTAMWGWVFLVTTMLVWGFKSEERERSEGNAGGGAGSSSEPAHDHGEIEDEVRRQCNCCVET